MRFMMLVILNGQEETDNLPDREMVAAMMKYNEALAEAGVLIALDGLQPSSKGARVAFSGNERSVTDGPFTESKELLGGYWMIEVPSKEAAIEWAKRSPFQEGVIEIRQVFEITDFPDETRDREAERRINDSLRTS